MTDKYRKIKSGLKKNNQVFLHWFSSQKLTWIILISSPTKLNIIIHWPRSPELVGSNPQENKIPSVSEKENIDTGTASFFLFTVFLKVKTQIKILPWSLWNRSLILPLFQSPIRSRFDCCTVLISSSGFHAHPSSSVKWTDFWHVHDLSTVQYIQDYSSSPFLANVMLNLEYENNKNMRSNCVQNSQKCLEKVSLDE